MAERTTRRRKKKENAEPEKPTKEETAVARHLRFNLPTKSTSIDGHKVEYFTGSKAVEFLQDSKWATGKGNTEILFSDRNSIAHYLDGLLWKGLFYRALKVVKKSKKEGKEKEEGGSKKEKKEKEEGGSKKEKKGKKEKKKTEAEPSEKGEDKEKEVTKGDGAETKDGGKEGTPTTKKREGKKKIKLELTDDQKFVDGNDAFVWVFDPIRPMNYVYGFGLVIGAIAVCLFPLWPPWMRVGTYYLSLCGAGFVGAILGLAVVRLIFFVLVWGGTFGKIHFWLFPNLLADVGIKESFIPCYTCDLMTHNKVDDKDEKTKETNGNKNGEEDASGDTHNQEKSQDPENVTGVENIPENIGVDEGLSDKGAENSEESAEVTEELNVESGELNDEDDGEEDGEEEEEDEDEDENGGGFEMIDEEEISEVCEGSTGSHEEEE